MCVMLNVWIWLQWNPCKLVQMALSGAWIIYTSNNIKENYKQRVWAEKARLELYH